MKPYTCHGCGASVKRDRDYCTARGLVISTEKILEVGEKGESSRANRTGRVETQRRNAIAQREWKRSNGPDQ
jgi:hypothetical protein